MGGEEEEEEDKTKKGPEMGMGNSRSAIGLWPTIRRVMVPHYTVQYIAKLVRKGVRQEERRGKRNQKII